LGVFLQISDSAAPISVANLNRFGCEPFDDVILSEAKNGASGSSDMDGFSRAG
jgi:hypothetical protein